MRASRSSAFVGDSCLGGNVGRFRRAMGGQMIYSSSRAGPYIRPETAVVWVCEGQNYQE